MLPVYVSHAKFLTDRAPRLEAEMKSIGLDFEWITDFDAESISPSIEARYYRPGHEISRPKMSNTLKHVMALERVAASDKTSLIVEDDISFFPNARSQLEKCLEEFPHQEAAVAYISCGSNHYTPARLLNKGQMLYPANRSRTTDAYIITPKAARARLDWIDQFRLDAPTDHTFSRVDRELGVLIFWAEPPFAVQQTLTGGMRSTMSPKRMKRSSIRIAAHFYGRRLFRYYVDRWMKTR